MSSPSDPAGASRDPGSQTDRPAASAWPMARSVVERDEVESTSDLARELVLSGRHPCPLLVLARRQTRGRGRGTNSCWSDEGSLTFTLAIDPAAHGLAPSHEPRLALAAAVAVVDAISAHVANGEPLGVRWPNDVEAGGRKLGGILPERVQAPDGPRLLVGVGLNVRTRLDHAPPDVRRMAASLADTAAPGDEGPDPDRLLADWLSRFESILPRLARDDEGLAGRWASLDVLLGVPVRVDLGTRVVSGVGAGIDAEGALRVETGVETLRLFGGQVLRA